MTNLEGIKDAAEKLKLTDKHSDELEALKTEHSEKLESENQLKEKLDTLISDSEDIEQLKKKNLELMKSVENLTIQLKERTKDDLQNAEKTKKLISQRDTDISNSKEEILKNYENDAEKKEDKRNHLDGLDSYVQKMYESENLRIEEELWEKLNKEDKKYIKLLQSKYQNKKDET